MSSENGGVREPGSASSRIALADGWAFRRVGDDAWLPAVVPGSNFTDLWRNGVIDDPRFGENEAKLQWIEKEDWEYRCLFETPGPGASSSRVELVFEGLDTLCEVTLNGVPLLSAGNMFCAYRIECGDLLRPDRNELRLLFKSPVAEGARRRAAQGFRYPAENDKTDDHASVFVRKAPYHFGWDWGPKYVTSGVWRPVYLDITSKARIRHVSHELASLSADEAMIDFAVEADALEEGEAWLEIGSPENGIPPIRTPVRLSPGESRHRARVIVENPRLWWPNGLGEPFLYRFEVRLSDSQGVLDETAMAIGVRTIEVVNRPDEHGECFYLKVNGVPVFMKGANYIPQDSFQELVTLERHRQLFQDVIDANMNMLRVWGGGVYESDLFYDLADKHGVLVWQDFMFSCTLYPSDADFLALVREEATQVVRRLRHHACLALWCGNNEISLGIAHWNWPEKFGYSPDLFKRLVAGNTELFESLLPSVITEHDPSRFYFPSSPIGFWNDPLDDCRGDGHYWGVWHGELPFSTYEKRLSRFMSEYGFQSYPLLSSIERFTRPEDRHGNSDAIAIHQKHPRGDSIIERYLTEHFGSPRSFEHFCYLTQVLQADGLRVAFEAHRRNMPFCMGSLYWQLNDCWPAISWSSIDYYGQWKALHYQAARSFAPVLISVETKDGSWIVHGVSDLKEDLSAALTIQCMTFSGTPICDTRRNVVLKGSASQILESIQLDGLPEFDRSEAFVAVRLTAGPDVIAANCLMLETARLAALPPPDLQVVSSDGRSVTIETKNFARAVHVSVEPADRSAAPLRFDDNFIDLLPGERRTLRTRGGRTFGPSTIKLVSVYDAVEHFAVPDRKLRLSPARSG